MEPSTIICSFLFCYVIFYISNLINQKKRSCCYMLHYECYKAPEERHLTTESCARIVLRNKKLGIEQYRFLFQTICNSGIGEATYAPKNVVEGREENPSLYDAYLEMDEIIFGTIDNLFAKTGISPSEIDILVVNVSLFSPSPSLTARVVNRYKMRDNIKSFNMSGMGCSASLVAVDLVQQLFKTYTNKIALVVSTESLGPHWYCGKEKSMMLSNCLFRAGGCSMLLTNNSALKHRAVLKLGHLVRTHIGSDNEAYGCCIQVEDDLGYGGFLLTRSLTKAAAKALTMNLRVLVPKILPVAELLRYVFRSWRTSPDAGINLKVAVEHFCIHPGGKAVIEGLGKSLGLDDYDLEPARMALHRFGNTSAGGLWYVLGYMEAKKRLEKGDRILMISLGAGFKCNNCVWEVMKDLEDVNVWKESIDEYPPPNPIVNPFKETYNWINDEYLSFVRLHF
ncbi:3-ketoacyl-CoA synthase 19-like [Euphorbia lathyris]|uniref:3-ketoacyl-CoA synthase 19-like n=1 Tax=Euphorbia lathyris TaxID=212925 RepID=UPI00331423C7